MRRDDRGILLPAFLTIASITISSICMLSGASMAVHPLIPTHPAQRGRWDWVESLFVLLFALILMRAILLRRTVGDSHTSRRRPPHPGALLAVVVFVALAAGSVIQFFIDVFATTPPGSLDRLAWGVADSSLQFAALGLAVAAGTLHEYRRRSAAC